MSDKLCSPGMGEREARELLEECANRNMHGLADCIRKGEGPYTSVAGVYEAAIAAILRASKSAGEIRAGALEECAARLDERAKGFAGHEKHIYNGQNLADELEMNARLIRALAQSPSPRVSGKYGHSDDLYIDADRECSRLSDLLFCAQADLAAASSERTSDANPVVPEGGSTGTPAALSVGGKE